MTTPFQAPDEIPSAARMYDYYLGGYHNFSSDRTAAEAAVAIYPDLPRVAQANRAFLRRAVDFLTAQGIDQFLDLGSGIPTVGNVHEVAQSLNPAARVVYVDIDPVAVTHSASLLADNPNATVIQADGRQGATILNHPETRRLLDLDRPVAVLLVAFLHFVVSDADALNLVRSMRAVMAPGSYLAISHGTHETTLDVAADAEARMTDLYAQTTNAIRTRTHAEISAFFEGFALVEPGLVRTPLWRPDGPDDLFFDQPERSGIYAGVGRKP